MLRGVLFAALVVDRSAPLSLLDASVGRRDGVGNDRPEVRIVGGGLRESVKCTPDSSEAALSSWPPHMDVVWDLALAHDESALMRQRAW